jgi:hypothetical protein
MTTFSKTFYVSNPDGTEIKLKEPLCGMEFPLGTLKDCGAIAYMNLWASMEGKSLRPAKGNNAKTASYICSDKNCGYRVYLNRQTPGDTLTCW